MSKMDTYSAYPLISSDPYLSIWSTTDHPAHSNTTHWAGSRKRLTLTAAVDGVHYKLIGNYFCKECAALTERVVTPTMTRYAFTAGGAKFTVAFRAPLLLDDFDIFSTPITFISITAASDDGQEHICNAEFMWHDDICYDGSVPQPMIGGTFVSRGLPLAWMGQRRQALLCHSGDHTTIDWGYAYAAAEGGVAFEHTSGHYALIVRRDWTLTTEPQRQEIMLGYDDVASIQYFEYTARAWYARNGKNIVQALHEFHDRREELIRRCDALDKDLVAEAEKVGGANYAEVATISYRHCICAHKLIADRDGNPVFLSKENDSNGCIGTVDVSYPSIPLFLLYAPELVRAMCRPILRYANMPVWKYDFAPHDVGRYPYVTGQVYGLASMNYGRTEPCAMDFTQVAPIDNGDVFPPTWLNDGDTNLLIFSNQMPVEECGNMILMLAAAMRADGNDAMIRESLPLLEKWVKYLEKYGGDPGEQLCTDDFAGHLARNVNLAFKAVSGLAAYGWMMGRLGNAKQAEYYSRIAHEMAESVYATARTECGTALTLDGVGWSLKYNTIWDKLFGFGLLPDDFFKNELARYAKEQNAFGVPLDSRKDWTKSDWILWCAAMADDAEGVDALCAPVRKYLRETTTRVPFSDWYDTKTGRYNYFIARSVQGGIFMPLLRKRWEA